jgi:hypothetical protein
MLIHPRSYTLTRFADGELASEKQKRVAAHLAECSRCRATVASVRALGDAARASAPPAASDALWARIAARRASGERMLPPADAREASRGLLTRNAAAAAAAVAVVLIIAVAGVEGVVAAAQRGVLSLTPTHPLPGKVVSVHYRPVTELAGAPALELRARFIPGRELLWYSVYGDLEGVAVATLARGRDGNFSGTFVFPDSASYALFSVSTTGGDSVDTNSRALWDVVASQPDGRVSFVGLRVQAFRPRGTPAGGGRAVAAADRMVALYPDSAQSWVMQAERQGSSRIPHWLSVFTRREKRYATLDSALLARPSVSAPEMEAMMSFATLIEEPEAATHWRSRLLNEHPEDLLAIAARTDSEWQEHHELARSALIVLDRAWMTQQDEEIARYGEAAAHAAEDSLSLAKWTERAAIVCGFCFTFDPSHVNVESSVRNAAANGLRQRYLALTSETATTRSLLATRREDRGRRRAEAAFTLVALGRQLAASGQAGAARDTLALASVLAHGMCGVAFVDSIRVLTLRSLDDSAEASRLASAPRPTGKCGKDWMLH